MSGSLQLADANILSSQSTCVQAVDNLLIGNTRFDEDHCLAALIEKPLLAMKPDMFVLSEYLATNAEHDRFTTSLEAAGFAWRATDETPGQNRLLVASRYDMSERIEPIGEWVLAARENYLRVEVRVGDYAFDLVGLRVPAYDRKTRHFERPYAAWLLRQLIPISVRRVLVVGDFNFDPGSTEARKEWIHRPVRDRLYATTDPSNMAAPWYFVSPPGKARSFYTGSRLDHALRTRSMSPPRRSGYIAEIEGEPIMTKLRPSDHAALALEFDFENS